MTVKPLANRVLIKPIYEKESTVIETVGKQKPTKGVIVSVGPNIEQKIVVGDTVMFGPHSGTTLMINKEEYQLMNENELMAIFTEK